MYFACRSIVAASIILALGSASHARVLRICADPNNLPFSNERREGFENKIVQLLADELGADLEYTWRAQRRGFIRNTLNAHLCDLTAGTVVGLPMLRSTTPYYRSTYVFLTRQGGPEIKSLDDPALRTLKVGIHLIGDDGFNVPPAHALARRGIVQNVRGYSLYGDYREDNPPARLIEDIAAGIIDVGIVWGPLGAYFGALQTPPLRVTAVEPSVDGPLPMTFAIAMGVRRDDQTLKDDVDAALRHKRAEVDAILTDFKIPRVDTVQTVAEPAR